jgi:methionyl-tRNA synthetase
VILVCYRISQDLFLQLYENGFLTKESVEQLLCENCNRYLADRFVEGICPRCAYEDARGDQCDGCGHLVNATELISPRCKICQKRPVVTKSDQFFLELPKVSNSSHEVTKFLSTFKLPFINIL